MPNVKPAKILQSIPLIESVDFLKEVFEQFGTIQPGRMFRCHDHFLLYFLFISLADACRSAPWADALISRRALSEPFENSGQACELANYN